MPGVDINIFKIMGMFGAVATMLIVTITFFYPISPRLIFADDDGCVTESRDVKVEGGSMEPLIKNGDIVRAHYGHYECNSVNRDDIVIYNHSSNRLPIIKIVKGVPGDTFELKYRADSFALIINGESVKNSEGREFMLSNQSSSIIRLYEESYGGKIPDDAYIILGDNEAGSFDSTSFGLVSSDRIIAIVQKV